VTCHLRLRGALRQRADGRPAHELDGATVAEVVGDLTRRHPALSGWILDERGEVRRHINVYVNGEPARLATSVGDGDTIDVLPAISGGAR
jgi:molybdopterin converting factor small subunit